MSARMARHFLRRSTVAQPWRPFSVTAPEQLQQPQQPEQLHQHFNLRSSMKFWTCPKSRPRRWILSLWRSISAMKWTVSSCYLMRNCNRRNLRFPCSSMRLFQVV